MGAPARSPLASDVFADEDSVFRGTADERRIENAVEVVVAAHLFLVGIAALVAPRVEDVAVCIENVGNVGSQSCRDVEPVFGVDRGVREVECVGERGSAGGMRIFPVFGRKVALHVEHLAALRSGEDRAVGGYNGFVDVVGRGIAASGQERP